MEDAIILMGYIGIMSGVLVIMGLLEKVIVHFMDKE